MEKTLINKVAQSGIITINLENYFPKESIAEFDLKDYLFQGLILREKDFRTTLKEHDWAKYDGQHLLIYCSTDAIIPTWAYMLVAQYAQEYVVSVYQGEKKQFLNNFYKTALSDMDMSQYKDKRIVIKGCSDRPVPPGAYATLTYLLKPFALSIMYGEPCSTVPIYKKPKQRDR